MLGQVVHTVSQHVLLIPTFHKSAFENVAFPCSPCILAWILEYQTSQ